jgi:site-specific recombinase XerD
VILSEAIERYLNICTHTKKLTEHTLRAYAIDLATLEQFAGPKRKLSACDRIFFHDYVSFLFNECELKEASVKRRIACTKAMFRWLEVEEILPENPFRKMVLPIRLPTTLPKSLPKKDLKKLLLSPIKALGLEKRGDLDQTTMLSMASAQKGFRLITTIVSLEILFTTGIRVAELCALKPSDLNLSEGVVQVNGKGQRQRIVFLPYSQTRELIRHYLAATQHKKLDDDSFLVTSLGTASDTQHIRILIREAGLFAKLSYRVTPHMLRHSAATHLIGNGVDIRFVQKLLGHQSITTTQIYTHVTENTLKRVIAKGHPIKELVG